MLSMPRPLIKPPILQRGDKVAAVTLSWAGAAAFPHRYEAGKKQLQEAFGVEVIETPNALKSADELFCHPELRAQDLMWAFENPDIKAVFSIIGGDDSIRLLPYIDFDILSRHPKIFMGYSDTTITHLCCYQAGLCSIYGPSIMAGFDENGGLFEYMRASVEQTLFSPNPPGIIAPNKEGWTDDESLSWKDPANQSIKRRLNETKGWKLLQGSGTARGHLIGGCLEVLEMAKGTTIWPTDKDWDNAIMFLETSEEGPSKDYLIRCMRNYAASGILQRLHGIILGRPANVPPHKLTQYDEALVQVVHNEAGLSSLPIISQMDFGHTAPVFLLPYGAEAKINADTLSFTITESSVSAT